LAKQLKINIFSGQGCFFNLNHVVLFVKSLQGFALSQLEQRNLRGDEPSEQIPENRIVAERDDVLDFPEN
jgi:hypothetical protein